MEKVAMRARSALVALEGSHEDLAESQENALSAVDDGVRSFLKVLSNIRPGKRPEPNNSMPASEEVLIDTEVDGCRYLVVRMPLPNHDPIRLSPREHEIVRMVAKGHPNKVIADVLNISSWTVCTHLRRIFAKLGVGSRAAMVAQLLQIGAIAPDLHSKSRAK